MEVQELKIPDIRIRHRPVSPKTPRSPNEHGFTTTDATNDISAFIKQMERLEVSAIQHSRSMVEIPGIYDLKDEVDETDVPLYILNEEAEVENENGFIYKNGHRPNHRYEHQNINQNENDDIKTQSSDDLNRQNSESPIITRTLTSASDETNSSDNNNNESLEQNETKRSSVIEIFEKDAIPILDILNEADNLSNNIIADNKEGEPNLSKELPILDNKFPIENKPRTSITHRQSLNELSLKQSTTTSIDPTLSNNKNVLKIKISEEDVSDDNKSEISINNLREDSLTTKFDDDLLKLWKEPKNFDEPDIRWDDDEIENKKPPAGGFRNLKFFFQFMFVKFHQNNVLFNSLLPSIDEWKGMRKVTLRSQSLKQLDENLEEYNLSVQAMKAIVTNSLILCYDSKQSKIIEYLGSTKPSLPPRQFNIGEFSILEAMCLFSFAITWNNDVWDQALNDESPGYLLMEQSPDVFHYGKTESKKLMFYRSKAYEYYCIAEHMNKFGKSLGFTSIFEWEKIKSQFKDSSNAPVLDAFDHIFHVNPKLETLNELLSDRDPETLISRHRLLVEPMVWLIYILHFMIERQRKLLALDIATKKFQEDNTVKFGAKRIQTAVSTLGEQVKNESKELNSLIAKLPSIEDLRDTFETEIIERDPLKVSLYTKSFNKDFLRPSKHDDYKKPKKT